MDTESHRILFSYLINHMFLPLKLPSVSDESDIGRNRHIFIEIVQHTLDDMIKQEQKNVAEHFDTKTSYENTILMSALERASRLFKTWLQLQHNVSYRLDAKALQSACRSLPMGDSLAVYLQPQNTCLLITRRDPPRGQPVSSDDHDDQQSGDHEAVVSYFQVSANNEQVMTPPSATCDGAAIDLETIVPHASLCVADMRVLCDMSFAQLVADLANGCETSSTTRKAGREQCESRDVAKTHLVRIYFCLFLLLNFLHFSIGLDWNKTNLK